MTDVGFYHLTRDPLERALPKLLEKVLASGARALVLASSEERVEALASLLWTYHPDSWLPHGTQRDGSPAEQPIWLSTRDENVNQATILVLTDGATSEKVSEYARCLELFDGGDPASVQAARERWSRYKQAGHGISYFQQTERGGWEKKA